MDLKTAIQKVTGHYDWAEGETADPAVAVRETRELMPTRQGCHDEIDYWDLDDDLATAHHTVIDASDDEIAQALA